MKVFTTILVVFSWSAHAHIKLLSPSNWQKTDAYGTPNKLSPCGEAGVATNAVTEVEVGSQLAVQWSEPINHPGHFRISIADDRNKLVDPKSVEINNDCISADVDAGLPTTLRDNLFPHGPAANGKVWNEIITVPNTPCNNCTLQVMQFMSQHPPNCFYHQCATLRIVARDAGTPAVDAGPVDAGIKDAGLAPFDAGLPDDAGAVANDAGVKDPAMNVDAGLPFELDAGQVTAADGGRNPVVQGSGCTTSSSGSFAALLASALLLLVRRRASL
jgi:hypothetical protein